MVQDYMAGGSDYVLLPLETESSRSFWVLVLEKALFLDWLIKLRWN